VESGQGTPSSLQASLLAADAQVYIRTAVETGRHAVWYIDAVVAPPAQPPGWQPLIWEYDAVTFIAAQVPSRALAAARAAGTAGRWRAVRPRARARQPASGDAGVEVAGAA